MNNLLRHRATFLTATGLLALALAVSAVNFQTLTAEGQASPQPLSHQRTKPS